MTFSQQIVVGLVSGIVTGLFFGERASATAWVADGFVKLLQMMVLPYITVSIIASLGSLAPSELRTLGVRTAAVIGGLWLIAITFALLIPLTFPSIESASFFSSSLVERPAEFDFLSLYVTSNPFHALANNIVPAVVLFSIVLGCALVGIDHRERLLDVLLVARAAISRATRFVTRLTPIGLFAIAANAAGTLDLQQLGRLQIYLIAYVAVALLVSLWVLPGLVAALTPIRARDMLRESQDSLMTAAIAGDLFIVLPALTQASRTLLNRLEPRPADADRLTDVIVPASFNFPHTGKLLSLSFILFAGWFADAPVPVSAYPQLALAGLVSFFGSLTAAVPFMLDLLRIPADTFQLFLATGVINSRVGSLLAAVHTLTVALLATCAITGHLRWRRRRVMSYAGVTVALVRRYWAARARCLPRPCHRLTPRTRSWRRCSCCTTPSRRRWRQPRHRHRPRRSRRSRRLPRAAYYGSATCLMRCRSRSSIRLETLSDLISSSLITSRASSASRCPLSRSIATAWRRGSTPGIATW